MEKLEAQKILQEQKVLIAPEDIRSPQEIVEALGLAGVNTIVEEPMLQESAIME